MAQKLPPEFYRDLMSASRKSGNSPEDVMTTALELYRATLLRPDSKDRLRVFAAQFHKLASKEGSMKLSVERRTQRSSLAGQAAADNMTADQRQERASRGGRAVWANLTPEQRRQKIFVLAEARRRGRQEREQGHTPPNKSSAKSPKRSRS